MQYNFDARSVTPIQPMEPVPEAWYPVVIAEEEPLKVNGKETWYLKLSLEVIDGPYKGRKLFTNLNIGSDNPKAVEIAHRELSAICYVTGQFVLNDQTGGTAALKGKPFQVKATVKDGFNEIKGYKDMQGNDPGKTGGQAAHAPAPMAPPPQTPAPQQPAWGQPPAAAPQAQAPAWGQPPQAPAQAPAAAPAQPAWGGQPPGAPAPAPAAAPPWGGGQPAQPAAAAPAAAPAWTPGGAAPAQAPWAR